MSLEIECDGDRWTCTVDEFLADNAEDAGTCEAIAAMQPGDVVRLGGGAAPVFVVTRSC